MALPPFHSIKSWAHNTRMELVVGEGGIVYGEFKKQYDGITD
jgi:hypothetical protein